MCAARRLGGLVRSTNWRLELTISHLAIDATGTRVLALPHRTQTPPNEEGAIRSRALTLLDGTNGNVLDSRIIEPLAPHFASVEAWDSVALAADGSRGVTGLADGRALLFDTADGHFKPLRTFELATPPIVGTIPIVAAASYAHHFGERVYLETQNTHIPFGSTQAANQAPVPHHGANTLTVTDLNSAPIWRYRGPFNLTGSWCDGAGHDKTRRWLLVTCRERPGAGESAKFGGLLFDLERPGGGNDKLAFYYPTAGPVIFNADISRDGRLIALVEIPAPTPDGHALFGTHQVHVLH